MFALPAEAVYVNAASAAVGAGPNCGLSFLQAKSNVKMLAENSSFIFITLNINNLGFVTNYHLLNRFQLAELGIIHVYL